MSLSSKNNTHNISQQNAQFINTNTPYNTYTLHTHIIHIHNIYISLYIYIYNTIYNVYTRKRA